MSQVRVLNLQVRVQVRVLKWRVRVQVQKKQNSSRTRVRVSSPSTLSLVDLRYSQSLFTFKRGLIEMLTCPDF
jgi:hypothetical protein